MLHRTLHIPLNSPDAWPMLLFLLLSSVSSLVAHFNIRVDLASFPIRLTNVNVCRSVNCNFMKIYVRLECLDHFWIVVSFFSSCECHSQLHRTIMRTERIQCEWKKCTQLKMCLSVCVSSLCQPIKMPQSTLIHGTKCQRPKSLRVWNNFGFILNNFASQPLTN